VRAGGARLPRGAPADTIAGAESIDPSHYKKGFHSSGTIGTFGAMATAARLLGLDAQATAHAVAIAASLSSGIRVNFGTMTKPLHVGRAGQNGVLAACAMILFINAYRLAETNFVAPFEYSAMIWAVMYGLVLFGDFPDVFTWIGAAIVIAAGIAMILRDRQLDRSLN